MFAGAAHPQGIPLLAWSFSRQARAPRATPPARALRALGAGLGVAAVLFARHSWALDVAPTSLDYEVAAGLDGCPDAARFRELVAARLGYDPFAATAGRALRVRIEPVLHTPMLRGEMRLRDGGDGWVGGKSLEATRCEDVAAAMALAASMAIDPAAALAPRPQVRPAAPDAHEDIPESARPARGGAPPESSPVALPMPVARDAPEAPPRAPSRSALRVTPAVYAGAGAATLGEVPGPVAAVVEAGVAVERGWLSVELGGRYVAPSVASSVASAGAGQVRVSAVGAELAPCVHVWPLVGCATLLAGVLQGSARNVQEEREGSSFFSAVGLRLGVRFGVGRARVEPFLEGTATLTSTDLLFRGETAWSSHPLGLSAGARVALPIP
jgi:hypothetical protein